MHSLDGDGVDQRNLLQNETKTQERVHEEQKENADQIETLFKMERNVAHPSPPDKTCLDGRKEA